MLFIKKEDFNTRKELLSYVFSQKNITTYIDQKFKKVDIAVGSSGDTSQIFRSITDLHKIVLSQFPKTKFESTVKIILNLINQNKNIALVYCTQINKVVVKYTTPIENNYLTSYSKKNYYKTKGVDGYSLEDYINMKNNKNETNNV